MEFKEEEVVTKKSTIDVQSGEVHKVFETDNTVSVVFQEEKNDNQKIKELELYNSYINN